MKTLTVSDRQNMPNGNTETVTNAAGGCTEASRKERRKAAKREKRKKKRQETAELARREEEARLNDPEELLRLQAEEEQERLRVEKERKEFEERERRIIEEWQRRQYQEQEEEEERRIRAHEEEEQLKQNQIGVDDDDWEYVEDGPPEIIWKGNEIIVKKKKIRVKKKGADQCITEEDPDRPTSNPLPPQSEAFADYKDASMLSAQELLDNVAQETPNFGTEQDKAHCPFHLKTGACRFGSRCSRIHFYPDKSCTLLIKNMYTGPGLAWEQDEGLEYTDEEVERAYEEFYEDVHTEFLKFGEIVNFKVCRNGSAHLRGNLYVHYKSLDSAVMAYHSMNARYYAGKQLQCEFVGVTRWKVAICGEFMKSKLQTCSRGTACNFIHCFRNPGGDYEWADWDKPPPKYWLKKMIALFGLSDEYGYGKPIERESPRLFGKSSRISADDADRHHSRRYPSREIYDLRRSRKYSEDYTQSSARRSADRKQLEVLDEDVSNSKEKHHSKISPSSSDSDESLDRGRHRHTSYDSSRDHERARRSGKLESLSGRSDEMSKYSGGGDSDDSNHHGEGRGSRRRRKEKRYERSHGDPSDVEHERANAHKEKSLRCYDSDQFNYKNSTRRRRSSIRDDSGRGDGKMEHDNRNPSNRDQSYRSDSRPRYYRKDADKLESGEAKKQCNDHHKRSKRKRGAGEKFDSECHEAKISCSDDHRIEELIENRDRWEHNDDYSLLDSLTDEAKDKRGRWEPD